jgi:hypothetical protein
MRIIIEFDTDTAAFDQPNKYVEVQHILERAQHKIIEQMDRAPAVCDSPEEADILRDHHGNVIGSVEVIDV